LGFGEEEGVRGGTVRLKFYHSVKKEELCTGAFLILPLPCKSPLIFHLTYACTPLRAHYHSYLYSGLSIHLAYSSDDRFKQSWRPSQHAVAKSFSKYTLEGKPKLQE